MGVAPEVQLVVKHTFLEFVEAGCAQEPRVRAMTDTALFKDYYDTASSSHSEAAEEPAATPKMLGLSTPFLEPATEPAPLLTWAGQAGADLGLAEVFPWMPPAAVPEEGMQFCMDGWAPCVSELDPHFQPCLAWMHMGLGPQDADLSAQAGFDADLGARAGFDAVQPAEPFAAPEPFATPATSSTAAPRSSQPQEHSAEDGAASVEDPGCGPRTTLMLRGLPEACTRDALLELLDGLGFNGHYDLVYVPMDFSTKASLCYAFVNAVSPASAEGMWACFDGFQAWPMACEKACAVCWSDPHQGVDAHVARYRNSPVMHESVPEPWKPALFKCGVRVPFPAPTRAIKAPKAARSRRSERG